MTKHSATITIVGDDKAGAIARITQALFQLGANIEALEEQVTRRHFSMTLQAYWSEAKFDAAEIKRRMQAEAAALRMEVNVHFTRVGPRRMAIFVTRESHVLEAILATTPKKLGTLPVVVIGSRPDLEPLARKAKLPFHHVSFVKREESELECLELLKKYEIDLVVLARFMKILSPNFVWWWKNKIINIHPSLLPAFPGANAYRQAYEKGVKIVGVTAHFVTPNLDEGPILDQESMRLKPRDTLPEIVRRGQALEVRCLLRAIKTFATHELDVHWGRVRVA